MASVFTLNDINQDKNHIVTKNPYLLSRKQVNEGKSYQTVGLSLSAQIQILLPQLVVVATTTPKINKVFVTL